MSYEQDLEKQNEKLQEELDSSIRKCEVFAHIITRLQDTEEKYKLLQSDHVRLVAEYKKLKRTLELLEKDHKANKIYKLSKRARCQVEEEEWNALCDNWDDDE